MEPLFLSRLFLDPRHRMVQRDLADCYVFHQRLVSAFPGLPSEAARAHAQLLFRVEPHGSEVCIIAQSSILPEWSRLPENYLCRIAEVKTMHTVFDAIHTGMLLRFRLAANPTRRISANNTAEAEHWRGKRVDVRGEDAQLHWLQRKGEHDGFALLGARLAPAVPDVRHADGATLIGQRRATGRITLGTARFEGRLQVTDADRFRQTLRAGIGSGKAFGLGLLSVAPD